MTAVNMTGHFALILDGLLRNRGFGPEEQPISSESTPAQRPPELAYSRTALAGGGSTDNDQTRDHEDPRYAEDSGRRHLRPPPRERLTSDFVEIMGIRPHRGAAMLDQTPNTARRTFPTQ